MTPTKVSDWNVVGVFHFRLATAGRGRQHARRVLFRIRTALQKDARSKQKRSNIESSRANWAARGTHHLAKLVRGVGVLLNIPRHSPQESTPFQLVSCRRRSCASVSPTSRDGPPTRRPPRQGLRPSPHSPCRGARYSAGVLVRCSGRWRAKLGGGSVGDGAAAGGV